MRVLCACVVCIVRVYRVCVCVVSVSCVWTFRLLPCVVVLCGVLCGYATCVLCDQCVVCLPWCEQLSISVWSMCVMRVLSVCAMCVLCVCTLCVVCGWCCVRVLARCVLSVWVVCACASGVCVYRVYVCYMCVLCYVVCGLGYGKWTG